MRRAKEDGETSLQIRLTKRTKERLYRLQNLSEAGSITEAIRVSASIYEMLLTTMRSGEELFLRDKNGKETRILIPGGVPVVEESPEPESLAVPEDL
jgi:hypothetical protein